MSNIHTSNWTEERIEKMIRLWNDGHSAGSIAKELGGFSGTPDSGRNSVIGKLHRMGMVNAEKPRYTLRRGGSRRISGPRALQTHRAPVARIKVLRVVIAEPLEAPQSLEKPLLELHALDCKWPSGDGPYTFCGHLVKPGSAYCLWHCSIAYAKGTQKDVDRQASRAMGSIRGHDKSTVMEM